MGTRDRRVVACDGGYPRSKVARMIDRYELDTLGERLEKQWLDTGDTGMSLRELAVYFNERLLEAAVEDSDLNTLDIEIDTCYERLTGDSVSSGARTRTERRLARHGVDVDSLRSDFVTHQSIHTYLRKVRDVQQPERTDEQRREAAIERVQKLQDRTAAVTEDAIESLQREGLAPEGNFDVLVDIQALDTDSGDQRSALDLMREFDQ